MGVAIGRGHVDYVVLDTCVLVNCTLVNAADADPELLVTISDKMRDKGVKMLLPSVVELEYERKVPEELALIKKQTRRFRDAITTEVLPSPDVSRLHAALDELDARRNAAVSQAQEYVAKLASDTDLTIRVALDGDVMAEAAGYALAGRKPSGGPSKGILDPDSLIVASIACFARAEGLSEADTVLICSDNHKDFGVWDPDGGAHVISPDIAKAVPCAVRYHKSPRSLVEKELEVVVNADSELSEALEHYDGISKTLRAVNMGSTLAAILRTNLYAGVNPGLLKAMDSRIFGMDPDLMKNINANLLSGVNPALFKNINANPFSGVNPALAGIGHDSDEDEPNDLDSGDSEDSGEDTPEDD